MALWAASCALVLSGAALLCGATQNGPFDLGTSSIVTTDPGSGTILDCETVSGPCSRALATDSVGYALSLPLLTSGITGLLLGLATCAGRARRDLPPGEQPPDAPHEGAAPQTPGAESPLAHELFMPPDVTERDDPDHHDH